MSSHAGAYPLSGALPVVAVIAVSGVVALWIAAWLIRDVAHAALQKSSQEDVPRVLFALGGLLDQLRLFLPWRDNGHRVVTPRSPGDQRTTHTEEGRDLPEGGSQ
jgi:hypothetical protein